MSHVRKMLTSLLCVCVFDVRTPDPGRGALDFKQPKLCLCPFKTCPVTPDRSGGRNG